MYAIIAGCGLVGSRVATMLSRDGHNVSVIDKNPDAFNRLPPEFDGGCWLRILVGDYLLQRDRSNTLGNAMLPLSLSYTHRWLVYLLASSLAFSDSSTTM